MGNHTKNPNYEEDSKRIGDAIEAFYEECRSSALQLLADNATNAANRVISIANSEENFSDPSSESLKLNAAKYNLKLVGLEIERSEVESKGGFKLIIDPEHAQKVLSAAE